jgi:gluconolactonase
MSELVTTPWRELASGTGFTEGPVALGDWVGFVSVNRGTVYRARLDGGGHEVLAETGGGPNGAAVDASGRLWLAQNGGRVMESRSFEVAASVQRIDGAEVTTLPFDALNAPNDCAFGPDGRLWITDPHGRRVEKTGDEPTGKLWAYDPATGDFELIAGGLPHPNGLCFTPDGTLLVSDTKTRGICSYAAGAAGWTSTLIAELPWGAPDGMALDEAGRLWVAATDAEGIAVLDRNGEWSLLELGPSFATNVCFAGADRKTVVVTAARGGRVLAASVDTPGLELSRP